MIDKSLRYKYQWGGPGGKSPGTSASGGSRNGSHDRGGAQHRAAAQRAAPAPSPHRDDSAERAAQAAADALNAAREAEARETAREKAIQVAALTPKTIEPIRSAHVDTPTQIAEQKEIDLYGYQDAKARAPTTLIPRYKEVTKGVPFLEDPITQKQRHYYGPIGSQIQPTGFGSKGDKTWHEAAEAGMKRGFWDSGLGNLLKGAGAAVALPFASAFLPKDMMTALTWGKRAHDFKKDKGLAAWLTRKAGLDPTKLTSNIDKAKAAKFRDERTTLGKEDIENWERKQDWSAVKPPKDGGDGEATLTKQVAGGEDVVTKTANQFAGTEVEGQISSLVQNDLTRALQHYAMMTSRIEAGYAPNRQEMDVYKLLEYYLNQAAPKQQNVAYGGRIDKPLTGRSRDI